MVAILEILNPRCEIMMEEWISSFRGLCEFAFNVYAESVATIFHERKSKLVINTNSNHLGTYSIIHINQCF